MGVNQVVFGSVKIMDISDSTVTADSMMAGDVAYGADGEKVVGTFSLDNELTTQDDLIAQITTALEGKAAGGGSVDEDEWKAEWISLIETGNCTKLPDSLISIDVQAFYNHRRLALTELPAGIKFINTGAFYNCSKLALTELPAGVKFIGHNAFAYCDGLTTLTMPGVEDIGNSAFEGCMNLNTIVIGLDNTVCTLSTDVFNSTPIESGTGYIYVPDALVDSYKTATNWSTYASQIKPLSEYQG